MQTAKSRKQQRKLLVFGFVLPSAGWLVQSTEPRPRETTPTSEPRPREVFYALIIQLLIRFDAV